MVKGVTGGGGDVETGFLTHGFIYDIGIMASYLC
jgi:hypothetical protein